MKKKYTHECRKIPLKVNRWKNLFFIPNLLRGTVLSAELDRALHKVRSPKANHTEKNPLMMQMAQQAGERYRRMELEQLHKINMKNRSSQMRQRRKKKKSPNEGHKWRSA